VSISRSDQLPSCLSPGPATGGLSGRRRAGGRRGFTLIELLVVIAIIGILIALLLPAVQKVREAGARTECTNKLRQWGLALHNYHDTYKGFPPGNMWGDGTNGWSGGWGIDKGTWMVYCLPFMEEQGLYDQIPGLKDPTVNSITLAQNAGLFATGIPRIMRCPSDPWQPQAAVSNYVGNVGPVMTDPYDYSPPNPPGPCEPFDIYINQPSWGYTYAPNEAESNDPNGLLGMFCRGFNVSIKMSMVTDGTSNTLLIGETLPATDDHISRGWFSAYGAQFVSTKVPINWPIQFNPDPASPYTFPDCTHFRANHSVSWGFRSYHSHGANFCFVDGSIHFISEGIDMRTFQLLGVRNDGQAVSVPD
jgi:prepilin-type N-terminal cleavage/methylation domain-containing protein/prepilin-type processing-associated H-X9-DG protein